MLVSFINDMATQDIKLNKINNNNLNMIFQIVVREPY